MTWKTHLIGGAQVGVILAAALGGDATNSAVVVSCSMLGSVLPDIDHPGSKLARSDGLVRLSSGLISKVTKHRGFTHTLPGAAVFAVVFFLLAMLRSEKEGLVSFFAALAIFLAFHLTGDALRYLAGWFAAGIYLFGPCVAEAYASHSLDFGLDKHAAYLCAVGIFAGCLVHIAYDCFNKGGVMLLYPLSRKTFSLAGIKTNTAGEAGFAMIQVLILAVLIAATCRDLYVFRFVDELINDIRYLM